MSDMSEVVQYKTELTRLTDEYWKYTEEEQKAAIGYIQAAINRGKALVQIKNECKRGEWGRWCADNDVERTTAWRYMQLADGEEKLKKFVAREQQTEPSISIREALVYLEKERKSEKEAAELQENIIKTAKRFMESLIKMKEFIEKNPEAEFDIEPEFVFAIDEAKIALDGLNERYHYDRSGK